MIKINEEKLARLHTADEILEKEYGAPGTPSRDAFEARAKAWYYAELLKEERKRQKLTQQQLADASGVTLRMVQLYEQRQNDISKAQASVVIRLAKSLGCEVENLVE